MKIAVVGSGVSGLAAAYYLAPHHDTTLFEKNARLGGHSRTVNVAYGNKSVAVDTGFIVFNELNYPNLCALFDELGVVIKKSDMSFGVSINDGWLEYGTSNIKKVFAQKRNLVRPQFIKMLWDILRFNQVAPHYLNANDDLLLGELLDRLGLGKWFCRYHLSSMGAAIWSMPLEAMRNFPAKTFLQFFQQHGLLTVNEHPQWLTLEGGAREYIKRIIKPYENGVRLKCAVKSVRREGEQVLLSTAQGTETFDKVIFACHANEALAILQDATDAERNWLSRFTFQKNQMVLHSDISFLPKRKGAWSSWNFYTPNKKRSTGTGPCLSYWMNYLQSLPKDAPHIIVTMNPHKTPNKVYDTWEFQHPIIDAKMIEAQKEQNRFQVGDKICYCGAWLGYGFHEDGLKSALRVAQQIRH